MITSKTPPGTHVHVNSLDSVCTIDDFISREQELETGHIAVTDHGHTGACLDVYRKAKEASLIPILGVEAYHRDDSCGILKRCGIERSEDGTVKKYYKYGHLLIHCLDQEAYQFLGKKLSDADLTAEKHGSERKPIFNWQDLEQIGSHNVIMSSGCLGGIIEQHLLASRLDIATAYYEKLRSIVRPGNLIVELFPHDCSKNWKSGVFITLEGGEKLEFYPGKRVKTDIIDEITVTDLARMISAGKPVGKLVAVKHYNTWNEVEAKTIVSCIAVEDFVANECTEFAPDGDVQLGCNKFMLELANKYGDLAIISDDAHMPRAKDRIVQESKLKGMGGGLKFWSSYHRHSGNELLEYFTKKMGMSELEYDKIANNNFAWASRFKDFKLEYTPSLPKSFYPVDSLAYTRDLIQKRGRMDWTNPQMVERLRGELELLHDNTTIDLLPYFFPIEEVYNKYREAGELTGVGRGSAGGLLLAYLIGVTHVNPLKFNLSKDRFLTLDRIETGHFPDVDSDLPNPDILLKFLEERFRNHYAQVSTDGLLRLKNSIKDVARAVEGEVSFEINKICSTLPTPPQGVEDRQFIFGHITDEGEEVKGLLDESKDLQLYVSKYPKQWAIVQEMLGTVRQKGRHASAYVITDAPITDTIPLMTVGGVRTTSYTANSCEAAGAIKYDFLKLTTLNYISTCMKIIQAQNGIKIDQEYVINGQKVPGVEVIYKDGGLLNIWDLPEDQAVFNSICEGNTETVFQLDTESANKWLKEFNYWKVEKEGTKLISSTMDLAVFTALNRPGPLDAEVTDGHIKRNMLQEYASRLRGARPIGNIEFLDKELKETEGVIIFQEDLTAIYKKVTGCSGVEAEGFRRKIGKKKLAEIMKLQANFVEKGTEKFGKELAERIWGQLHTFAKYGFCKAHSVEYAITAYVCAYLKHYFPLEWWCGVLSHTDKNKVGEKFWKYCKDFVDMPDIRHSGENYLIKDGRIITPLSFLQGVGEAAHEELLANMPYTDIRDFCQKIAKHKKSKSKLNEETQKVRAGVSALNKGVVYKLIVSGVMDSLFPDNFDIISKFEMYEQELALALNKKKPDKIDEKYIGLNSLKIYQYIKSILPIYSEYLAPKLYDLKIDGVTKKTIQLNNIPTDVYSYLPKDAQTIAFIQKSVGSNKINGALSIINGPLLHYLNKDAIIDEDNALYVAVAAYVLDSKKFSFKDKKTGETKYAMEVLLDIDGEIARFVKWQNRKSKKLDLPEGEINGSIVIAILNRWSNKREFSIDAIIKVIEPLEEKK